MDNNLNETDTAGDEGEHFAAVVNGETLSPEEIARIASEDDSATIFLNGETIILSAQQVTTRSCLG